MSSPVTSLAWPARAPRRWFGITVLSVHGLLLWALLQLNVVETAVQQAAPLMVQLIGPAPERAADPAPALRVVPSPPAAPPVAPALPVPEVPLPRVEPAPEVMTQAPSAPAAPTPPVARQPSAVQISAAEPPALPRPPAVQQVPPGALRYRVEPPVAVPRASRRQGESGTVLLRVVVDVQGLPRSVTLHRSSGFRRLDEQALGAMRQARFFPCTDGGQPVECESIAPIVYELEN